MTHKPTISILTDFGLEDPYVGIMKGVITGISPATNVIDLNHRVPPGAILQGAVQLWQAQRYFPAGTIFLGVVDPGVGTFRKGIAARSGQHYFVGPDNGLFTFVLTAASKIHELAEPAYQLSPKSNTFHGRDIFAPAAAHLAAGVPLDRFGAQVLAPATLPDPVIQAVPQQPGSSPRRHEIRGEILFPDRFGNLLTSLGTISTQGQQRTLSPWTGDHFEVPPFKKENARLVLENGKGLTWVDTFAEIPTNDCAALVGSSGLIEIAARGTSAAARLGLSGGERVVLQIHSKL
jgi:S-adenosylmethionine hydrolase